MVKVSMFIGLIAAVALIQLTLGKHVTAMSSFVSS